VDKKIAAEKIRALLEGHIARLLGCDVGDLHSMKIGSMAHFLFLLVGDSEVMPGFNKALSAHRSVVLGEVTPDQQIKGCCINQLSRQP